MADRSHPTQNRPASIAAFVLFAAALPLACGKPAASYPDRSAVSQAQAVWCDALAKVMGEGDKWKHLADCKDAYPTASAEYLKRMSKCFPERVEAAGENAPDYTQLVADCTDDVTLGLPADGPGSGRVLKARCERMLRCEEVPIDECKTGIDKLETAQRAMFTTTYNAKALDDIASCLGSSGCTDNEEAARDECYRPFSENLLWFPN